MCARAFALRFNWCCCAIATYICPRELFALTLAASRHESVLKYPFWSLTNSIKKNKHTHNSVRFHPSLLSYPGAAGYAKRFPHQFGKRTLRARPSSVKRCEERSEAPVQESRSNKKRKRRSVCKSQYVCNRWWKGKGVLCERVAASGVALSDGHMIHKRAPPQHHHTRSAAGALPPTPTAPN